MKSLVHPSVPLVALLLWLAPGAGAQPEPGSLFVDRIDVNVVNIEVFVTDRSGRRVVGLSPDDFEVYEDGRLVEISNFYAVAREDEVLRDVARGREALDRAPRESKRQEHPKDQQLNLMVYVDNFNIRPANRKRVLAGLVDFLEDRVTQGDNVMLVSFNRNLEVVQPFTQDSGRILDGVKKLGKGATYRQIDDAERRRIMIQMRPETGQRSTVADNSSRAYSLLRTYVQKARNDLRLTTSALGSVARSLSGLPGRKAILYVSDGVPMRPGESLYQLYSDIYGSLPGNQSIDPMMEAVIENENRLMNDIIRQANAHEITFYTLDARGPGGGGQSLSAEFRDLSAGPAGHIRLDAARTLNLQEPLIEMAEATGGSSILNTYNFDTVFNQLADDFDSFYSLGYRSHHGGDGRYHKVEVKVKRPGARVRHRTGFVDKPEVERVADRTLSSLILNLEKNPLRVHIDFGLAQKKSKSVYHLPVMIRVPFNEITLLPNGEVEQGRLRIFLAVQDEEGGVSSTHEFPYPISIPRDQSTQVADREVGYSTTLKIRPGVPKVAVGVWDELSGTESYVHKSVPVGKGPR